MRFDIKEGSEQPPTLSKVSWRNNSVFYSFDGKIITEFKFHEHHFKNKTIVLSDKIFQILNTSDVFVVADFAESFPGFQIDKIRNIKFPNYDYGNIFSTYLVRKK